MIIETVFVIIILAFFILWVGLAVVYYFNVYKIVRTLKKEDKNLLSKGSIPLPGWNLSLILFRVPNILLRNPDFFNANGNVQIYVQKSRIALKIFLISFGIVFVLLFSIALISKFLA